MSVERVIMAVLILIGILMCIFAVIGALYWGLMLLWVVLLFIGGVLLVILVFVAYFLLI